MTDDTPTIDESDYPLRVGDRVFDRYQIAADDEDVELAIVLRERETDVYETSFSSGGVEQTVAELDRNQQYADFDVSTRVVGIAFAPWLAQDHEGWREYAADPEGLIEFLEERNREWSTPLEERIYDYPETRLKLVNRP